MAENTARTLYGKRPENEGTAVLLCADDYALAPGVSTAIRDLVARGRLSATSCMTLFPRWPEEAARLAPLAERADVGLHLTLTDHPPLAPMRNLAPEGRLPSLGWLVRAALARRFVAGPARHEIRAEVRRQLAAFEAAMGRPPDLIDGHQHVHVLPGVRDEVLALFAEGLVPATTLLRVPWEPPVAIWRRGVARARALAIGALSLGLKTNVRARGLMTNDGFRGVRDFRPEEDYRELFRRFVARAGARPMIMCHPGHVDAELARPDPVTACRAGEFAYLASDAFVADMAAAGRRLARAREWRLDEPPAAR